MADGLTTQSATLATVPASTVIATDDAGGSGHVQVVKLAISTDGSAQVIPADTTNGMDVDVTRLPRGTSTFTAVAPVSGSASVVLAANTSRKAAIIENVGTVDCYLGASGLTTSNGLLLYVGASLVDDTGTSAWYGRTASGTADLRVCEVA